MFDTDWDRTLDTFHREAASITEQAGILSKRFTAICRDAESFKVVFLSHCLERQRRHLARSRGITSVIQNKKGLVEGVVMGLAGLVRGAMISENILTAGAEGLSGFETGLRGLGETSWVLCIEKDLRVWPRKDVATRHGEKLVTWESFSKGLTELGNQALQGVELGDLDSILSKLKDGKKLVYVIALQAIRVGTKDS